LNVNAKLCLCNQKGFNHYSLSIKKIGQNLHLIFLFVKPNTFTTKNN
jgi:hypothetical protein